MIFSVNGELSDILDDRIVLVTAGLGYEIFIPERLKQELPAIGEFLKVHTYHHVREDQQSLFGFLSLSDKDFFNMLISVSGVGPKVALKMLSDLDATLISSAIVGNNIAQLTQISGVGKKMAERLIIELKDKVSAFSSSTVEGMVSSSNQLSATFKDDLSLALKALGYTQDEVNRSIQQASARLSDDMSIQQAIKTTLKSL